MQLRHVLPFIALLGSAAHAEACKLRMAMEQWPPYLYRESATGAPSGMDWELAQAILKEAGCTLSLQAELPPARRKNEFERGRLDLQLAASVTADRKRYARFSLPYRHETMGVFTLSSHALPYRHITDLDMLVTEKLPLLAPRLGWYGPAYARVQPMLAAAGQVSTYSTYQQGLQMLHAGRADLILGDRAALRHAARAQGYTLSALPVSVLRAPVRLMLNKGTTTQADLGRIDAAIQKLDKQGALAEIRARYDEP